MGRDATTPRLLSALKLAFCRSGAPTSPGQIKDPSSHPNYSITSPRSGVFDISPLRLPTHRAMERLRQQSNP